MRHQQKKTSHCKFFNLFISVIILEISFIIHEIHRKGGMMMSALMALSIGSIISMFYRGEFFNFILACGGAAVFSMYIIYDLQMIMGDRALKISPEEYIFAALTLYVDIVRIFLELLKILRYLNEAQQSQQRDKKKRN
jgi:FtsH-binding integral membrane protein